MFLKLRSSSEKEVNDKLIDNFDAIAAQIISQKRAYLSDQDMHDFMNFLGDININAGFSLQQIRRIENIVRRIPLDFELLDEKGERLRNTDFILGQLRNVTNSLVALKVVVLLNQH